MTHFELNKAIILGSLQNIVHQIDAFDTSSFTDEEFEKFKKLRKEIRDFCKKTANRVYKELVEYNEME